MNSEHVCPFVLEGQQWRTSLHRGCVTERAMLNVEAKGQLQDNGHVHSLTDVKTISIFSEHPRNGLVRNKRLRAFRPARSHGIRSPSRHIAYRFTKSIMINRSGPGTDPADGEKLLFRAVAVSSFRDRQGDHSAPLATGAKKGYREVCFREYGTACFRCKKANT